MGDNRRAEMSSPDGRRASSLITITARDRLRSPNGSCSRNNFSLRHISREWDFAYRNASFLLRRRPGISVMIGRGWDGFKKYHDQSRAGWFNNRY